MLQFNLNATATNTTDAIFQLKQFLVSVGWTITESSDGTTYSSSGDIITSSSSGANGFNNNYAWFTIQQPSSLRALQFQRGFGDVYFRIKYSAVGFHTGTPSAILVSSAPTLDNNAIFGLGSDHFPGFYPLSNSINVLQMAADSSAPYGFYFITYALGIPNVGNAIILDPVINAPIQDTDQYVVYIDNSIYTLKYRNFSNPKRCGFAYYKRGLPEQAFAKVPANYFSYLYNGVNIAAPFDLPTNPINSNDDLFPIFYILSTAYTTVSIQYKGVSSLMKWCGTSRTNASLIQLSSPGDRIIFGNVNLPWNNTTPVF